MEILGTPIRAGKRYYLELDVASLYTRTKIEVPVIVERSRVEGPSVLIMGGIHGDEVNGIEIIRRLLFERSLRPSNGTVIAVPIANVMAFLNMNRKFADGRDLNRSFPGRRKGSLASQVAHSLTSSIIPHATHVIDLHTGAEDRFNAPQVRYDHEHPQNALLADAFAAPFTIQLEKAPRGSIRRLLNRLDKPVIVFEGGKSKDIDEDVVKAGMTGVLNVLRYLKVIPGRRRRSHDRSIHLSESRWIRARNSGMFQPVAGNGSFVEKGELLGYVNGPFAQFQRQIKSPVSGWVFCVNEAPVVYNGDALFHIGSESPAPDAA